jgi:drug/metabolite transporter (DMT)-like permease
MKKVYNKPVLRTLDREDMLVARDKATPKAKRNDLGLVFGVMFILAGVVLLYSGTSNSDASDFAAVLGGAVLLSVGSIVLWILLREWLKRKRELEESKRD